MHSFAANAGRVKDGVSPSPSRIPYLAEAEQWLQASNIPEKVAVAWSGGADSTALLLALHAKGLRPVAWHIDHAWHRDSIIHTSFLQQRAEAWGIPFYMYRLNAAPKRNREAEARQARYATFSRWGSEQGIRALCLGHHLDDQTETVFLRLLQGSGVNGCRGMQSVRSFGTLILLRPLLSVPRHQLEGALQRADIDWLNDPSNRDLSLRRNHIRNIIFPRMRECGIEPRELFSRLAGQANALNQQIQSFVDQFELKVQDGLVSMNWYDWSSQDSSIRASLLQRMASILFGEGRVLGRRHILLSEHWLGKGGFGGLDLSCSRLYRKNKRLYLREKTVSKKVSPG